MTLTTQVAELRGPGAVDESLRSAWDALAAARGAPGALSAWALAALGIGAASHDARILVARDADGIAGLLPLRVERRRGPGNVREHELMEAPLGARTAILMRPGDEHAVAAALVAALARELARSPSLVTFARLDVDSPWPALMRAHWPGAMHLGFGAVRDAPLVELDDGRDAERWLAGRSANSRSDLRRKARALARRGATVRRTERADTLEQDVRTLFALHRERFGATDRTSRLDDAVEGAVLAAAPRLLAAGHLRLWIAERDGVGVAAQLHLRAGEQMVYWNGGFASGWERESPGMVLLHAAVRDAHELGVRRFDLGPGAQAYKWRFADASAPIRSVTLRPVGRHLPVLAGRTLAARARDDLGRRLRPQA